VTGVEVVIAPGELVRFGGPVRKDVASYDLRALMIGSEGTLGIVTSAWLKLLPAPEARIPLVAGFASVEAGAHAIEELYASGAIPAAIDYLDGATLKMAGGGFPGVLSDDIALLLITEAESEEDAALIAEALGGRSQRPDPADLWRWRDGVLGNVSGVLGAMTSEDFVVPLDRFGEAVSSVIEIGRNAGYEACSWGHAGDGNLHATVVHHPDNPPSTEVAQEFFDLAVRLGGTVSGEHGIGSLKRGQLSRQWEPAAVAAHNAVKQALDPKGLFNPGKKQP
jgi:FAD/FMN-containing dehydrogenase